MPSVAVSPPSSRDVTDPPCIDGAGHERVLVVLAPGDDPQGLVSRACEQTTIGQHSSLTVFMSSGSGLVEGLAACGGVLGLDGMRIAAQEVTLACALATRVARVEPLAARGTFRGALRAHLKRRSYDAILISHIGERRCRARLTNWSRGAAIVVIA